MPEIVKVAKADGGGYVFYFDDGTRLWPEYHEKPAHCEPSMFWDQMLPYQQAAREWLYQIAGDEVEYCPACDTLVKIESKLDVTGLTNRCVNCGSETTGL